MQMSDVTRGCLLLLVAGCAKTTPTTARVTVDAAVISSSAPAKPDAGASLSFAPDDLIDATTVVPGLVIDIRYATANNFVGKPVYPAARCLLRGAVAQRLAKVARDLQRQKLRLKVWDCYRPFSVQETLWQEVTDPRYVARPERKNGKPHKGSKHNRGAAVDLTLIDHAGNELAMPTDYDDFSERAHRGAAGIAKENRRNSQVLERAMQAHGFFPLPTEWWHFDGPGWKNYPLADEPLLQAGSDSGNVRKR